MDNESNSLGIKIVVLFDVIVSIIVGIRFIPSDVHILLRILIIFAVFFVAFFIMNVRKFGIGLIAITALIGLFTWIINGLIVLPYVEDAVWMWILRVCAFLICFLGHWKLTVWDTVIKNKISR